MLLLAIPVGAATERAQLSGCDPGAGWATLKPRLAARVLALINHHRAARGLHQLALSPALEASARWKSMHMARFRYFTHEDPAPPIARGPFDRVRSCGFSRAAGENIAYGYRTARLVIDAWLASPGHRENIERAAYRTTGIGVAVGSDGVPYWTQDFGA